MRQTMVRTALLRIVEDAAYIVDGCHIKDCLVWITFSTVMYGQRDTVFYL